MDKEQLIRHLKNCRFNEQIISAFKKVPREEFIPRELKPLAYEDTALSLEKGATISQPYTIAFMLNLLELKPEQKILEIGSGSGYVLALIYQITNGEIYGIEIINSLAESSKQALKDYKKIRVINKNGAHGLKEKAPFDRILISASSYTVPEHLFYQLKENGMLVAPINNSIFQFKKIKGKIKTKEFPGFVFVKLMEN